MASMTTQYLYIPSDYAEGNRWTNRFTLHPGFAIRVTGFGFIPGNMVPGSKTSCSEMAALHVLDVSQTITKGASPDCGCTVEEDVVITDEISTPFKFCGCPLFIAENNPTLVIQTPGTYAFRFNDDIHMPQRLTIRLQVGALADFPRGDV